MRLLDYAVKNAAPIRIALDRQQVRVEELQLVGDDTRLRVSRHDRPQRRADRAEGDRRRQPRHPAGLLPRRARRRPRRADRRRSTVRCAQPHFSGSATITDGRIRHFSMPNSLDAHQRHDSFRCGRHPARRRGGDDGRRARAVRRPDRVRRLRAGGARRHGARRRHAPARARRASARWSTPTCRCAATFKAPTLGGTVTVKSALWNRRVDTPGSIFDLASRRSAAAGRCRRPPSAPTVPLKFDLQLLVPSTLRVENNLARMVASADLHAARHLRSAGDRRPRRRRARRGDVRGAPLSDHARHDGLHQPGAHRAVLRRRGGDQRARAGPDLPRDGARSPARASSCARRSTPIRRCRPPTCSRCCSATSSAPAPPTSRPSCARCRIRTRRRPTS